MTEIPQRQSPAPAGTSLGAPILPFCERRKDHRRPVQTPARLTVLDGPLAGSTHDVQTRDLSLSGISFLLRQSLAVGQNCRVDMANGHGALSRIGEVVRSRPLSNGKYEMGVQFRK